LVAENATLDGEELVAEYSCPRLVEVFQVAKSKCQKRSAPDDGRLTAKLG
jgi:hypothetical protein